ncbi:MAG: AAA family ATPase [Pseudonocardiaceae bacterium]
MGLVLRAVDVTGPRRWRWLLADEQSGASLAEHQVELDPGAAETQAFEDLYRFLLSRADPDRRVASEAELLHRVGAWIGSVVLGERIGLAIATAAPVTVRVVAPAGAEFLASRPLELAHIAGTPMAAWGHVALVHDLARPPKSTKRPVGPALRMLAVFSRPTVTITSGTMTSAISGAMTSAASGAMASELRRERYELPRLVRRAAARGRRRVEVEVAQCGVSRAVLADLTEAGGGWDVLHLSGLDTAGNFLLENPDGSADPVSADELIELLYPLRRQLKLAVVSSGQSAAAATAQTLRQLGLAAPAIDLETRIVLEAGAAAPIELARELTTKLNCAVVAMRYPVAEEFALGFAEALYDQLFRNTQPLDRAVAAAAPAAAGPTASAARPAISVATPAIFGTSAVKLSLAPPFGQPVPDFTGAAMTWFPPEPPRFVGRAEVMAAASSALAPESGRTAVLLHGMAGVGKTTCAVELAYRHQRAFGPMVFWAAPTDPDQFSDALRLLAITLESQLDDYGVVMLDNIVTLERLENFLPTLATVLADAGLLLVLDNLETLLTPEGQWRDLRWVPLVNTLTGRLGSSRVILTSRIAPGGLNQDTVLVQPLSTLTRDECLLLTRQLPNLRALLHPDAARGQADAQGTDPALSRRVLTRAQGHATLLELADATAADPTRLDLQLAEVDAAVSGAAPATFLTDSESDLDAEQLLETVTAWINTRAAMLPASSRLLLQVLCRIEVADRSTATLGVNWAALWRRLDQPGDPPSLVSSAAPLVTAVLVATEPARDNAESNGPVHYRIQPAVADAVQASTPDPVLAAIDAQLASWWTAVGAWGIKQQQDGKDTSELVSRASLTAAGYLLRQHDWDAAICILDRILMRDGYSLSTSLAAIPLLRRVVEATGAVKDLVVLGAALRKVDPGEAETLLRHVYDQAATTGDYQLASTTAGDLVTLMRDQGRLREALTLAGQKIEHTGQAGFGLWTQLSDRGRWLQILSMLGYHEQVLTDLPGLRDRIAKLPGKRAGNDRVNPSNVREGILDVGRCSAVALERWQEALELGEEIAACRLERGAGPHEVARTRFHNYLPLLHLDRLAEVDQLLRECEEAFETAGDMKQLAVVHSARADLEARREHPEAAVELQRSSLRLEYLRPDPREISMAHHNLADYLFRSSGVAAEQRAHRLTAALLNHLTGDTGELTRTLGVLARELRSDSGGPAEAPPLPTTLQQVTQLVDAGDGVRFGTLVVALCTDPATAEQALADLLATAATSADQHDGSTPVSVEQLLAGWTPLISALAAAAADGDTPPELTGLLEDVAVADWAALVAALRRILAGDRSRDLLLTGLDDIGAAVVTATLDRLSTHPKQA